LGSRKGIRPVKTEWWGAGMVICLELGADLHLAQLMPLPLTLSCFSKIETGFTFLVLAYPGSPGKGPLNRCIYFGLDDENVSLDWMLLVLVSGSLARVLVDILVSFLLYNTG